MDEVFLKINGRIHYLWRAVDQDGELGVINLPVDQSGIHLSALVCFFLS